MTQALEQEIRKSVVDSFLLGQDDIRLGDADSFVEYGIIDSTTVLELVLFLEARLGVKIADAELPPENLDSIDSVAGFVRRKAATAG